MKNVLLTGGAGFIGSFVCEELLERGFRVVVLDNLFRGSLDNLADCEKNKSFRFVKLDLSMKENVSNVRRLIRTHSIDTLIHAAAVNGTQYFYERPSFVFSQNNLCTSVLLEAARLTAVKKVVYISSSEVYGEPMIIPTPEDHPIILRAETDRDSYAASKAMGEFDVRFHCREEQIEYLIIRTFNIYGERMVGTKYGQVVGEFVARSLRREPFTIIGDGSQTRSFCYVRDYARIVVDLLIGKAVGIVNLGNDHEVTILELARLIHQLLDTKFSPIFLPPREHDHQRRKPDISKVRMHLRDLNFTALNDGLARTIDWYKKHISPGSHE